MAGEPDLVLSPTEASAIHPSTSITVPSSDCSCNPQYHIAQLLLKKIEELEESQAKLQEDLSRLIQLHEQTFSQAIRPHYVCPYCTCCANHPRCFGQQAATQAEGGFTSTCNGVSSSQMELHQSGSCENGRRSLHGELSANHLINILQSMGQAVYIFRPSGVVTYCLDTFPYTGTTTTCESLYMGVPCITMAGSVHANNVGVTLLHQVGLEKLIAQTEDEYVSKTLDLA